MKKQNKTKQNKKTSKLIKFFEPVLLIVVYLSLMK